MAFEKKTEGRHPLEGVKSLASGDRSLDNVIILSGQNLPAMAVLAKVTHGAATAAAKAGGNTGGATISAVVVGSDAMPGVHSVRVVDENTNLGDFAVHRPNGTLIGYGRVGTEFVGGGLTFTVTDVGTDLIAGDGWDITVAAGSGKYALHDPDAVNGRETAVAILLDACDASAGDTQATVIARDAEVVAAALQWETGLDTNGKAAGIAELATRGIIAR